MNDTHPPRTEGERPTPTGTPPPGNTSPGEEYAVDPADPNVGETIEQLSPRQSGVPSSAPPARPLDKKTGPTQFTLPMLFALTLATSLVFALMRTVPAGVFAATLGLFLALAALAGMTRSGFGTMLWWTLLGVYSTAVVVLLVAQ